MEGHQVYIFEVVLPLQIVLIFHSNAHEVIIYVLQNNSPTWNIIMFNIIFCLLLGILCIGHVFGSLNQTIILRMIWQS